MYAKQILGFERFSSQIRDIEKNCLLMLSQHYHVFFLAVKHQTFILYFLIFFRGSRACAERIKNNK
jgi:hypothetical protein